MGSIFLVQGENQLLEMTEQQYDSEDLLQTLLVKYPNLLAGDQIDPGAPRRWLLVKREAGLPSEAGGPNRWSVDHLFLDQDAIPTVVEVKRSTDTRSRREVVGQGLEYAANAVVNWPIEDIRARFEARCEAEGLDPEAEIRSLAGEEVDLDAFWQKTKTNLQAGKIRLIFVADEIAPELGRMVEFLNSQMDEAEVLAIEVKQHVNEGVKVFVVRLIGQTVEAQQRKSSAGARHGQWDLPRFMTELEKRQGVDAVAVVMKILDWAKGKMPETKLGKGTKDGNITPFLNHKGTDYWLITLSTNGKMSLCFAELTGKRCPFNERAKRLELLQRVNAIPGMELREEAVDKYPNFPILRLQDKRTFELFSGVLDWFVEQVKAT